MSSTITPRGERRTAGTDTGHLGRNLGFRRIESVRIVVGGESTTAEVTGVSHRYPRTRRISLATAARLIAAGAPMVLEHRPESR